MNLASDWHGRVLQAALNEQPSLSLDFYSYGVLMRKREGDAITEYAVDPAQVANVLAAKVGFDTGLFLPCNVTVYEDGDEVVVTAADPNVVLGVLEDDQLVCDVAAEARVKLKRAIETLNG